MLLFIIVLYLFFCSSHYVVYAVPVTRGRRAATTIPYTPIVPVGKLIRKAVSAHLASTVTDKLPFIVGTYEAQKLPEKLLFDGSSESLDFKPDTHYAFVVAAFTETKVRQYKILVYFFTSKPYYHSLLLFIIIIIIITMLVFCLLLNLLNLCDRFAGSFRINVQPEWSLQSSCVHR